MGGGKKNNIKNWPQDYQIIRSGSSEVINSHLRGALSIMRDRRPVKRSPVGAFLERVCETMPKEDSLSGDTRF